MSLLKQQQQQQQPERWEKPRDESRFPVHNEDAFLAFGGGPRICLGMNLARNEILIGVAALLHRYQFALPAEKIPHIEYSFSLNQKPFEIDFIPRRK